MFFRGLAISILLFSVLSLNIQAYSQQRIKGFYLSNFKEDGSRAWEVKGEEAVIYEKHVDIDYMHAKYYAEDDTIDIVSRKAKMNTENMNVHLKDDVVVTNKEGLKLSTDYLNWQRDENKMMTDRLVKVSNDSMEIKAEGLLADTEFKKADFQKNVEVTLPNKEDGSLTTITCSGPLEVEYNKGIAVFNGNVEAIGKEGKIFSDKLTLYMDVETKEMKKMVSEGNVKIVREGNVIFSQKATYLGNEGKLILEGRPRLLYFSQNEDTADLE